MFGRLAGSKRQHGQSDGAGRRRARAIAGSLLLVVGVLQPGFAAIASADPASPVSVVKTASSNPVASGAELTYTVTMTNLGSSKVNNVVMTDQINGVGVVPLPPALPQLTITSTKGTCTQGGPNGNLVTCNAGTLNGSQVWTVTIRGQVTAANNTTLNNTASVTGTKSAQTFTTTGSVSVDVRGGTGGGDPLPDLTINKTGPTSVALLGKVTYTLTINNLGTADTADVVAVDTLPSGVTLDPDFADPFETTSLFTCLPAGADPITVTCSGGAVNQGQNATIKIHALAPNTGTSITNTAVVDPNNAIAESNELNNTSATVNTSLEGPPAPALLSIAKTDGNPDQGVPWDTGAGPDPVNPGEWLTYVIHVQNNATSRADDVRISDTFQGLEASSLIVSQAIVDGSVGTGRGCVVNAAEAICSIRSLNAGGTMTMTVKGYVIAPAGSNLFNTATVHGNIKNVGLTNTATESTTVRPSIDLNIVKTDTPDPACARTWPTTDPNQHLANPPFGLAPAAGSIPNDPANAADQDGLLAQPVCLGGLTYRFVVGNSGNGDASNVVVRDPLAAGLIFDSYSTQAGSNFTCAVDAANVVTCSGGFIPKAQTRWIELRLVAPPNVGSITNTVYVDPNNAIFEPDETNNTDTETTQINTGIDLVIWKGDDATDDDAPGPDDPTDEDPPGLTPNGVLAGGFDPIATNGTQTYTILVDNVGPQDVTGIKVRDVLPAGTKFLSFSADNGFTCTHDGSTFGGNVTCIGGHLMGTEAEFYDPPGPTGPTFGADDIAVIRIKVFATPFVQPIMHNEVRVDPDNEITEVNELNNFAEQNTFVTVGDSDKSAFNQLTVDKIQCDPAPAPAPCPNVPNFVADADHTVAQNGVVWYDLKVSNQGTDPVSAVIVKDFLPVGSRFIQAFDTDTGTSLSDAFFCFHDGAATGGTITCLGGDLSGSVNKIPDGAGFVPTERHIRVKIFAPNTPGSYPNIVVVDPDNVVVEGNEFDNDDAWLTTVTIGGNNMFNELNVTKSQVDPATTCGIPALPCVATSSVVTYELLVKNDGTDPAFQVLVRDTLPAGFAFISADDKVEDANSFECTNNGNVIDCVAAMVPGGGNRTIVVKAFAATQPGVYTNQAVVDPGNQIPEGNETNNTSQQKTRVVVGDGFIDLRIVKCDEPNEPANDNGCTTPSDPTVPDGTVTYVITVSNNGTDPAFNVAVRDILPAGTTFVSAEDLAPGAGAFTCSHAAGVVNCIGATIDGSQDLIAGVDTSRRIELKITAPHAKGPITNQAVVDPDNTIAESNETNNTDFETTSIVPRINLTLSKTGPDDANQNEVTEYVLTVKNEIPDGLTEGATAFNVRVVDPLPIGLIPLYVEADPSNMQCEILENPVNVVECIGDMSAPGASPDSSTVTITIGVFVTAEEGPLDNEACVDPTDAQNPVGTIVESEEGDNCQTKTTTVLKFAPDLAVSKNAGVATATPGQTITYTVILSNQGDATAQGPITLTDELDTTKVDFVDADATNGYACSFTSPNVECTGAGLAPGDSTTATIRVKVKTGATGTIENTASVPENTAFDGAAPECSGGTTCANEGAENTSSTNANNSDTETVQLGGTGNDLQALSLIDNVDATAPGGVVTYTAEFGNNGSTDLTGAEVRLTLPATGMNHVQSSASNGFTCLFLFPNVDCTGNLLSGGTTTVTLVGHITATAPPDTSVTVTATADPDDAIDEDDETNNEQTQTTTVSASCATGCIDLVMSPIVVTPAAVHDDEYVEYIIGVGNAGDQASGEFDITLNLEDPADFDFEPGGFDDSQPSDDYSATADFECEVDLSGDVTCTGELDGGEGVLIILKVHIEDVTHPFLTLTATADPTDAIDEFSDLNNEESGSAQLLP